MREDIAKVLVERPRYRGYGKAMMRAHRRRTRQAMRQDGDIEIDCPRGVRSIHVRRVGKRGPKGLNENLRPLCRFIGKNVGRRWDDVLSEIMQRLNLNNAVQYHVWQHTVLMRGIIVVNARRYQGVLLVGGTAQSIRRRERYVDPDTGLVQVMGREQPDISLKAMRFAQPWVAPTASNPSAAG
jgi:hypothetical protein